MKGIRGMIARKSRMNEWFDKILYWEVGICGILYLLVGLRELLLVGLRLCGGGEERGFITK